MMLDTTASPPATGDITRLLRRVDAGDSSAETELLDLVYTSLREMAAGALREGSREELQPTAVVHDAYLRLFRKDDQSWENRRHFFFSAARAMRDLIVEESRRRASGKRGGWMKRQEMVDPERIEQSDRILAVEDSLIRLRETQPESAQIIDLRFYAGLDLPSIAKTLQVSLSTAERRWRHARAWLARDLELTEHV